MVVGKFMPPTIQMSPFECEISQLSRAISCFLRGGGGLGANKVYNFVPKVRAGRREPWERGCKVYCGRCENGEFRLI